MWQKLLSLVIFGLSWHTETMEDALFHIAVLDHVNLVASEVVGPVKGLLHVKASFLFLILWCLFTMKHLCPQEAFSFLILIHIRRSPFFPPLRIRNPQESNYKYWNAPFQPLGRSLDAISWRSQLQLPKEVREK